MTYTRTGSQIRSPGELPAVAAAVGRTRAALIQAWFEENAERGASWVKLPVIPIPDGFGQRLVEVCDEWFWDTALAAAQIAHETAFLQSQIFRDKLNVAGIGAVNDNPYGGAIASGTLMQGLELWGVHMALYVIGDGPWRDADPRYAIIKEKGWLGAVTYPADLEQRWAWSKNYDAIPISERYGSSVVAHANDLIAFARTKGASVAVNPTDRMIDMLRDRGFEVHDVRGKLPVNKNPNYRYDKIPLSGVNYIIQHWTGDSFSADTIRKITGTDYGASVIVPEMTAEDEQDMLVWYANYHISKDGGTWGGIAYGTLVFPSGRIYVAWDIGTFTYHAFQGANKQSYALCCPNANWAQPTDQQMAALRNVWDILCYHTPEIPAGRTELYGHTEATFLDSRNSTSCPGTFLSSVQNYRASGTQLDSLPPVPPEEPAIHYPTGKLVRGFKAFHEELGQVAFLRTLGMPIGDEYAVTLAARYDADGNVTAPAVGGSMQRCERGVLVWDPRDSSPWDITTLPLWLYATYVIDLPGYLYPQSPSLVA